MPYQDFIPHLMSNRIANYRSLTHSLFLSERPSIDSVRGPGWLLWHDLHGGHPHVPGRSRRRNVLLFHQEDTENGEQFYYLIL